MTCLGETSKIQKNQTKTFKTLGLSLRVTRHHLTFLLERFQLRDSCCSRASSRSKTSSPTDLPVVSSPPEGEIKTPPPWSLSNMRACGLEARVTRLMPADPLMIRFLIIQSSDGKRKSSRLISSQFENVVSRSHHKRPPPQAING